MDFLVGLLSKACTEQPRQHEPILNVKGYNTNTHDTNTPTKYVGEAMIRTQQMYTVAPSMNTQ